MENYKILIYILIGVIYLLFKSRKKKNPYEAPYSSGNESPVPKKNTLVKKGKELTENTIKKPVFVPIVSEVPGESKKLNEIDYDTLVKDEESQLVTPRVKETDIDNPEKFEPYADHDNNSTNYGKLLKNPDLLKNAMVISEILTPKHF